LHPQASGAEHRPVPSVRLVASDLDGTLLAPGAVLTDRTRAALAAADAAGIVVVAATGRPATTAAARLAAAPTVRYLVCENGAVIYDRHEATVVARHPLDDAAVPAVVASLRAGLPGAGYGWEGATGYGAETAFLGMSPPRDGIPDVVVDRLGPPYPPAVTKLLVAHPDLVRDDLLARVRPCLVDGLVATASSVPFVEIAGAGVDKAYGVARLCERLGVDRAEVAALGDHINDIALLRWAGRSVAMGDAHPLAREAAGESTGSSAEDGAAAWLEALVAGRPAARPQEPQAPSGDGGAGGDAVG
jgi:hypothetical protein